jgi:hypothetical protein
MLPRRAHLKWLYYAGLSLLGREAALLQRIVDRDLIVVLNLHQVVPTPIRSGVRCLPGCLKTCWSF